MTRALEGFPQTSKVDFNFEKALFTVDYNSSQSLAHNFKDAAEAMVIASGTRKVLGEVGGVGRQYKH